MISTLVSAVSALLAASVTLTPGSLPAGPHPSGPHVDGRTLHDASMRMSFSAPHVEYLGAIGDRYVVRRSDANGSHAQVLWIRADEKQRILLRGTKSYDATLSSDGAHLLVAPNNSRKSTTVRVLSTVSGREVASRKFRGVVSVLDATDGRAVLGGWSPNRSFWWTFDGAAHSVSKINNRPGYFADIAADRLASYTGDPYLEGCSVLSTLTSSRLSRSCNERVAAVSPSGSIATVHILSDGRGPTVVKTRTADGSLLSTYKAPFYFGAIRWESDSALLMDTYGTKRWATVRCDGDDCERASKLRKTPVI